MKTGIVVSNYDPTYKNRVKIRVMGIHTEKVGSDYVILDDDLPWALPAPSSGGNSGTYSVPEVGSRVYVDGNGYKWTYYGQVEVKGNVKKLMNENAEQSDRLKVIAFSEDFESDDKSNYMKIYYLPENGLNIECMGHTIVLTKYDGIKIVSAEGCAVDLDRSGDVNIVTANSVNLKCNKVNLTSASLDDSTLERIVLGKRLQKIFNNHIHFVAGPGGVETTKPVGSKILDKDLSDRIMIGKNINPDRN